MINRYIYIYIYQINKHNKGLILITYNRRISVLFSIKNDENEFLKQSHTH